MSEKIKDSVWESEGKDGNETHDFSYGGSDLFSTQSLMSHNNTIAEFDDIKLEIERIQEHHHKKALADGIKATIPNCAYINKDLSPKLPGIVLNIDGHGGGKKHLAVFLFYKNGVIEESADADMPYGNNFIHNPTYYAEDFLTNIVLNKVKMSFSAKKDGSDVTIITHGIIDVTNYTQTTDIKNAIRCIVRDIFSEWYTAVHNQALKNIANKKGKIGPLKFFNENNTGVYNNNEVGVSQIANIHNNAVDVFGKAEPYNVSVLLKAVNHTDVNRQGVYDKSTDIAKTFFNVDLEVLQPQRYAENMGQNNMGPLVPVISIGRTIPLERFHENNNIVCDIIGIQNAITLNSKAIMADIFSVPSVGQKRGNISNFASLIYSSLRMAPSPEIALNSKSFIDTNIVNGFIRDYLNPRAVIVKDLHTTIGDVSNTAIYNFADSPKLLENKNNERDLLTHTVHHNTIRLALDILSGGRFDGYIETHKNNPMAWKPGETIFDTSGGIPLIPTGTGVIDGVVVNLEEVMAMMLLNPSCFNEDRDAMFRYMTLLNANIAISHKRSAIKNILKTIFRDSLNLVGFKCRFVISDRFLFAVKELLGGTRSEFVNGRSNGNYNNYYENSGSYLNIQSGITNAAANMYGTSTRFNMIKG